MKFDQQGQLSTKCQGITTTAQEEVAGRKERTRPMIGAAGCTKLMLACQESAGRRNMSTSDNPGWFQRELNGRGGDPTSEGASH